ncbi:MAG: CRISPR-associated endonuclease Cas2 [Gemmataceae bacterium]
MSRNVFIITYDITLTKRRNKVYKLLRGCGDALQYSVFHCRLTPAELIQLKTELWEILNLKEDRLVILDIGPQDGRGELAIDVWGKPIEEIPETGQPFIV